MIQKYTIKNRALALTALFAATCPAKSPHSISIEPIGTYAAGDFLTSAAEIAAYDPANQRLLVVNAQAARIDVLSITDPANPVLAGIIDVTPWGAVANSVAVYQGLIAVAVEADVKTDPGCVVFFDSTLTFLSKVTVGALPDMLAFTPDGRAVLVANEGEPAPDYSVDPEGSVSIIRLRKNAADLTDADVSTAGFSTFNGLSREALFNGSGPAGSPKPAIRVFGPDSTVAQNLEPEYLTISQDSRTAWVTLQEANAIAIIDIPSATVTGISGLGIKDHQLDDNGFGSGNALDASDRDGGINIRNWPVKGLYLPDAVASWKQGKNTWLILANEGDSRDRAAYSEEKRIGSMNLDPDVFSPDYATFLKSSSRLGRLKATTAQGDTDGDGVFRELYTFGTRSFSIRDAAGNLVWDSGDEFERIIASQNPDFFNSNHEENAFDSRSDDKGPEPEAVTTGKLFGRTWGFIGLERVGGVMVYDISEPAAPFFVQYLNNRDFTAKPASAAAGDLGPEGILFIGEAESPDGRPLLVVANEVSGTTTIYAISKERLAGK